MTDTPAPQEAAPPAGCPAHPDAVPLSGPQYQQTPGELYREMRRQHGPVIPITLDGGVPAWLVLGYRELHHVTSNDQLFARDSRRWHAWDSIPPAHITRWEGAPQVAQLKASVHRLMEDTLYAAITQKNNWLAAHDTAMVPLEVAAYLQFAAARRQNLETLNQLLKLPAARQDQASPASFSFMEDAAAYQRWLHLVQADLFVHATTGVLEAWVAGS